MLAGRSGVGKSTLINTVFGSKLAETGQGRPVTFNKHASACQPRRISSQQDGNARGREKWLNIIHTKPAELTKYEPNRVRMGIDEDGSGIRLPTCGQSPKEVGAQGSPGSEQVGAPGW